MLAIGKRLIRRPDIHSKSLGCKSRMICQISTATIKDEDCQDDFFVKFEESGSSP